jgi:hypothetical protein
MAVVPGAHLRLADLTRPHTYPIRSLDLADRALLGRLPIHPNGQPITGSSSLSERKWKALTSAILTPKRVESFIFWALNGPPMGKF